MKNKMIANLSFTLTLLVLVTTTALKKMLVFNEFVDKSKI